MADPEVGKLWVPESALVVLDDLLTDVRLAMYQQGTTLAVTPGTDTYIWNTAFANAAMMLYSQLPAVATASNPLYATGTDLDDWRKFLGLPIVEPSPSTGAIRLKVAGSATVPDGTQGVLPNGLRVAVAGTWVGVTDGDEVDVVAYDKGSGTNAGSGTVVRFQSAPLNVDTEATVSFERPLTGGLDEETEERKRTRILNRLAFAASKAGGNWGGLRGMAFDALASVQDCFIFPALGGPSGTKIVPTRGFDRTFYDFTRSFSTAAIALIRQYIQSNSLDACQHVVQSSADESLDVAVLLTIPAARIAGGNGEGWLDATVWPQLVSITRVTVSSVIIGTTGIVIDADTATAPVDGQTRIMWWSPHTMQFITRSVLSHSGSSGAWTLALDAPLVDDDGNTCTAGDYISPAAENHKKYASSWLDIMETLGSGENISGSAIAPRDSRRPFVADGAPRSGLTTAELLAFQRANPEITDIEYSYRSATSPTVPATIDDPPNTFVPRHFGIYQQ